MAHVTNVDEHSGVATHNHQLLSSVFLAAKLAENHIHSRIWNLMKRAGILSRQYFAGRVCDKVR